VLIKGASAAHWNVARGRGQGGTHRMVNTVEQGNHQIITVNPSHVISEIKQHRSIDNSVITSTTEMRLAIDQCYVEGFCA
jgi:hypothetical protein